MDDDRVDSGPLQAGCRREIRTGDLDPLWPEAPSCFEVILVTDFNIVNYVIVRTPSEASAVAIPAQCTALAKSPELPILAQEFRGLNPRPDRVPAAKQKHGIPKFE